MTAAGPMVAELTPPEWTDRVVEETSADGIPTLKVPPAALLDVLRHLKTGVDRPYRMLFDLTAIDERERRGARDGEGSGFTVVHQLLSVDRERDLRLKTAALGDPPTVPSATPVWPAANWYEREAWDMFGIRFDGHPNLSRILMPRTWKGHPLRKDHPARATEAPGYELTDDQQLLEQEAMRFVPEEWGLETTEDDRDLLFLNLGPQHPGTHGVLRVVLQLDGEEVRAAVPEIGFHHRGAEKMGERQTWHTYIPYTDRIDYLGGVMNNLPYVLAVERLAGIEVPERAQVIRVMLCELFRIISHLVWYGTFAQDLGALSPVFYTFADRERAFDVVAAICGDRMHPNWFRIGGVAQDLPEGWQDLMRGFVDHLGPRLDEYDRMIMGNRIFQARTKGVGAYTLEEALEWGVTGPGLRACGLPFDLRKVRPYSGYEQFDFDVPIAEAGDCYDRARVRVEEMRQSLRIIRQCLEGMPEGEHTSRQPRATPPLKAGHTMVDIETLIHHFLGVSWGPVVPAGESFAAVEAAKGINGYAVVSDGGSLPYRVRIRTPSFPHLQMLPLVCQGHSVADVLAILGSIDFVLADVDR